MKFGPEYNEKKVKELTACAYFLSHNLGLSLLYLLYGPRLERKYRCARTAGLTFSVTRVRASAYES